MPKDPNLTEPTEPTDPPNPAPQDPSQGDPPTDPQTIADDPLMQGLFESLGGVIKDKPEEKKEPVIEKVELPEPGDDDPPKEEPPKEDPPKPQSPKVSKRQSVSKADLDKALDDIKNEVKRDREKPQAQAPEPKTAPEGDPYEENLLPEQVEELELARYIETKDDARKGYGKKLLEFYKALDKWVTDPDNDADPDSPEFERFVKDNKPSLPASDRRKFERQMIRDEARQDTLKEIEEREKRMEERLRAIENEPKVEKAVTEFSKSTAEYAINNASEDLKPVMESVTEKGWESAAEEYPVQVEVLKRATDDATSVATEFLRITNGITRYDEANPYHKFALDFVNEQGEIFRKQGGEAQIQEGKSFLPRGEFHDAVSKDPSAADRHWTFSNANILHMLSAYSYQRAENAITEIQKNAERLGYSKNAQPKNAEPAKKTTTPKEDETKPISAPKSKVSAAPPPGDSKPTEENHPGKELMNDLGLNAILQ